MQSPRTGFFLTFEGPDGSGKTTQLRLLADWFRAQGTEPLLLRQPGSTALGEQIRGVLLDSRSDETLGKVAPLAELALMFADRAQQIAQAIRPALANGRVILCDRYTDSSEAYQGAGRGLGTDRVLALHQQLCDNLQPDLTLLLLPDVEKALARASRRNERHRQQHGSDENRFEAEGEAFFRRVHSAYTTIAQREAGRVSVLTEGSIEQVHEHIVAVVAARWQPTRAGSAS